jgi:hypothetical protein
MGKPRRIVFKALQLWVFKNNQFMRNCPPVRQGMFLV